MSESKFTSTQALEAALEVVGAGTAGEPESFEDLVAEGTETSGGDDLGVRAADGGVPEGGEVIAGIEDPSAENIFAAYGFGNDLVFGDDELDYSVLAEGGVAALANDPIEAAFAPGFPDDFEGASAYVTDDDPSLV